MNKVQRDVAVYTSIPTPFQREKAQWRIAYVRLVFADSTVGVVALATAPLTTTPERMLRDTAETILAGLMSLYAGLGAMGLSVLPETYRDVDGEVRVSTVNIDSLASFERRHAIEYGALYLQLQFLERLEVAYEAIAKHSSDDCTRFEHELDTVYLAVSDTLAQEVK